GLRSSRPTFASSIRRSSSRYSQFAIRYSLFVILPHSPVIPCALQSEAVHRRHGIWLLAAASAARFRISAALFMLRRIQDDGRELFPIHFPSRRRRMSSSPNFLLNSAKTGSSAFWN